MQNITLCAHGITDSDQFKTNITLCAHGITDSDQFKTNITLCAHGITDSDQFKTNDLSYGSVIRQMKRWTFRPICFVLPDCMSLEQTRTNSTVQFTSRSLLNYNEKLTHVLDYGVQRLNAPAPRHSSSPAATHSHPPSVYTHCNVAMSRAVLYAVTRIARHAEPRAGVASNTRDTQSGTERWWWC
jgi:hypothetical protein